jgi:CcmD family protein
MLIRRALTALFTACLLGVSAFASQPPPGQGGFVQVNELPASEQLPAAPLLVTAYIFVWLVVMFYLWTIWRRLNKVEREMRALAARQPGGKALS